MSVLKFECPGCGQHLECDRACSGDIIHCPRCCAQLRIPFESMAHIEGSIVRAELVAAPPAQVAQPESEAEKPSAKQPKELICPVCEAQLRVPPADGPKDAIPTAELVRKATRQAPLAPPQAQASAPEQMSLEEREKQIAAAREAHPVSLYPPIKPRMDFVRTGEAPPQRDGQSAPQKASPSETRGDSNKSLSE